MGGETDVVEARMQEAADALTDNGKFRGEGLIHHVVRFQ